MLLKNPIFFGFTAIVCLSVQIGISYVSARAILDGNLFKGLFLFLLVPALGLLLVLYYLWFRRHTPSKPSG